QGLENLFGKVKDLSRIIGIKVFKREKIADVIVSGNSRIEVDAIKGYIKTGPGDVYSAKDLSADLKAVYAMGYFEDIRIEAEDSPDGKIIVFKVQEKPTIRHIKFRGNRVYDDEKLNENLNIRTGSILNIFQVNNNLQRIEELYKEKNYHNVKISYNLNELEHNQADLEFVIEEGEKVKIKTIAFEGNSAFTDKELKKAMKTAEKGLFSWITSAGELSDEDLTQDISQLTAFYHNQGYIEARVGDPLVEFKDKWIYIKIKIVEGPRYKVGEIDIRGDLLRPKQQLMKHLKIMYEEFYNREVVRNDVLALADYFSDEGYAYADIAPQIDQDLENRVVNITYDISKGRLVYFERIILAGNTKTRDKVIRRQLRVYEQELFSGTRLKQGVQNLYRLDYFDDVNINTSKGSDDDKIILKVDVAEKPTGSFSFGGGYSSIQNLFFTASVTQRNLFGKGQILDLRGEIGGRSNQLRLSFTEPWWFDIPLSAGFDLYRWTFDYDTYTRSSLGGALRFGYPIWRYTRANLRYSLDSADIKEVTIYAPESIKELEGHNITSSLTGTLRYDSRDRAFQTTSGSDNAVSVEHAGGILGGDIAFTKYLGSTGWYLPLVFNTVVYLHSAAGYVQEGQGGILPDYERFYLGGIDSVRGYAWREISLLDHIGFKIGGTSFIQFNIELLFPLVEKAGLTGVLFLDAGDVYGGNKDFEISNLRKGAGGGFRWYSPIGPIRIEYGWKIDVPEGEEGGGRWEFTMGNVF
ncbi:outer membrane protein assembly factor BamA, partial [Thermodesulfobacteriota bacterium]